MRDAELRPARTLRPDDPAAAGGDAGDDAGRLPSPIPGDGRSALWPGLARLGGVLPPARRADADSSPLPRGGEHPSRARGADGGAVGPDGGHEPESGPRFDGNVPADGYAWWYVDALSDDGQQALTLIAFLGSVFSPHYARARRHGPADPLDHCALNVAIYGRRGKRWSLTERPRRAIDRTATSLTIGPSTLAWSGGCLSFAIDEMTVPIPSRLRGTVRVHPLAVTGRAFALDRAGRHRWWPIAPSARVEVAFDRPAMRWSGQGYLDSNAGAAPLERDFHAWTWSRCGLGDGAAILYDVVCRDGHAVSLARRFDRSGGSDAFTPPPRAPLPRTAWRVARETRADADAAVLRTLEDTPFYARSLVGARLCGTEVLAFHESLDLDRFANRLVQVLLPFRMARQLS